MSSSRNIAAIASLPHTRFDGALGTGRSISLLSAGREDSMSMVSSLRTELLDQTRLHSVAWNKAPFPLLAGEKTCLRRPKSPCRRGKRSQIKLLDAIEPNRRQRNSLRYSAALAADRQRNSPASHWLEILALEHHL